MIDLKALEKEIEILSYQQECLASQYKRFLSINEDEIVFIKNICFALNIKPVEFVLNQDDKGKYYDENLCDYKLTFYECGKVEKTQIIMKRLPHGSWLSSIPKNEKIRFDYLGIKFTDDDSNKGEE